MTTQRVWPGINSSGTSLTVYAEDGVTLIPAAGGADVTLIQEQAGGPFVLPAYYRSKVAISVLLTYDPLGLSGDPITVPAVTRVSGSLIGALTSELSSRAGLGEGEMVTTLGLTAVDDGAGMKFAVVLGESSGADGYLNINCSNGQWRAKTPREVGYMDIRWFGAVGDRTTDCSAAIQSAVNAAGNNGRVFIPGSERGFLCSGISIPNGWSIEFFGTGYSNIANAVRGSPQWDYDGDPFPQALNGSVLIVPAGLDGIVPVKSGTGTVTLELNSFAMQGVGAGADKLIDAYRGAGGQHVNLKTNKFGTVNAEYGLDLVESYANMAIIDHEASGCTYPVSLGREGTGLGVTALTIVTPKWNGNEHAVRFGNCALITVQGGMIQGCQDTALFYGETRQVVFGTTWFENNLGDLMEMLPGGGPSGWSRSQNGFFGSQIDASLGMEGTISGDDWSFESLVNAALLTINLVEASAYVSPGSNLVLQNISGGSVYRRRIRPLPLTLNGGITTVNTLSGVWQADANLLANSTLNILGVPDLVAGAELLLTVKSIGGTWALTLTGDQFAGLGGGTTLPWTNASIAGQVCTARLYRSGFGWTINQGAWA
jgi:hypothetical protein